MNGQVDIRNHQFKSVCKPCSKVRKNNDSIMGHHHGVGGGGGGGVRGSVQRQLYHHFTTAVDTK
jgi:hypothetical protein